MSVLQFKAIEQQRFDVNAFLDAAFAAGKVKDWHSEQGENFFGWYYTVIGERENLEPLVEQLRSRVRIG